MSSSQSHVDPEQLRHNLLRLAEFIQGLDREGTLLEAAPRLLKLMGDLRSQLFEYEVRHTGRLLPKPAGSESDAKVTRPPLLQRESERIVREAMERQRELEEEWRRGWGLEGEA